MHETVRPPRKNKIGRFFRKPLHPTYRPINIAIRGKGVREVVVARCGAGVHFANTGTVIGLQDCNKKCKIALNTIRY